MSYNGHMIKEYQDMVFNQLTNAMYKNTIILFTGDEGLAELKFYMNEMTEQYRKFNSNPGMVAELDVPPEMAYTIEFINLMAEAGQGFNSFTELKAQSLFSIRDAVENLKLSTFCIPLKKALIKFMDHIYFDVEKDMSDDKQQDIWSCIDYFIEDIQKYIEI